MKFRVTYDILVEARSDNYNGIGRSDLQNLTTEVEALNAGQASAMVQAQNGGASICVVKVAVPVW